MIKKLITVGIAAALALSVGFASAQPSGSVQAQTPLTRDLGSVKTFTGQAAATITSADQNGFNVARLVCVYRQSTYTGSPSTTFTIQNKDAASGLYYDLLTSAAITTSVTANAIFVGDGISTVANVGAGKTIAKTWRVSITVGGSSTPTVTGTVGCSVQ